jgi:RimJ/RimL family protein N-acetyltransferase
MIDISSERLKLIPLDNYLLQIWHQQGRNAMEAKLGLNPSNWQIEDFFQTETQEALANYWIPMTDEYLVDFFWYTNWEIVLVEKNLSIGGIGLSGLPDQHGATMVGYCIDMPFRQQGFASEALQCLIDWASTDINLKTILADTPLDNIASQQVLKKCGFSTFGLIDEVQHIELLKVKHWHLSIR